MTAMILDGASLARGRADMIARRAAAVHARRGRPPGLVIVAFGDEHGRVPYVDRKIAMCAAAGLAATLLVIPPGVTTRDALERLRTVLDDGEFDGVFVQLPFPAGIDGDAFASAIPVALDIDIMTPVRIAQFMNGMDTLPPITVSAGLLLLEAYDLTVDGRRGIVVADATPFSLMFRAAFVLRGAETELVSPTAPDLDHHLRTAGLVVVAAGTPGLVRSADLARGAFAIDAGYFNPGGHGDIDISGGIDHLAALAPVPGGIGPMTVSALLERVVLFAERGMIDVSTPPPGP